MRAIVLGLMIGVSSLTHATAPAWCGAELAGGSFLARLEFTGWNSQFGYYRKMGITGVRQAHLGDQVFYVFDAKDRPTQIFRREDVEVVRRSYRLGLNGPIDQTFSKSRLTEVGPNGEDVAGEVLEINGVREYDGHPIERWSFVKNDGEQEVTFYDPVAEQSVIAARKADAERRAAIPEPGSREHMRQEIHADLRRQGLDPARQHWIEDEVNRQWADMWRMLTN